VHITEHCSAIFLGAEKEWKDPQVDKQEHTHVNKEEPMLDESKMLQKTTPTPSTNTIFEMQVELLEPMPDVVMVPNTTLEIQDIKVEEIQERMGRSRHKKRKRRSLDERVQVEFKKGDQVILYHHKSNMFPGSKSTRWSGPYLLNRVLKNDFVELWHKNSGYFMVRKIRLKCYKESDPIRMGITNPPDPKI